MNPIMKPQSSSAGPVNCVVGHAGSFRAYYCALKAICPFNAASVVIAENANKAKYAFYLSSKEAGYGFTFADFICKRLPSHDILINPRPCSRAFPINRPITMEDAHIMLSDVCGCSKCRLPNAQDHGAAQ